MLYRRKKQRSKKLKDYKNNNSNKLRKGEESKLKRSLKNFKSKSKDKS